MDNQVIDYQDESEQRPVYNNVRNKSPSEERNSIRPPSGLIK